MSETINKLVGHQAQRDYLARVAGEKKASHAYLFSGEGGVGRYGAALEFCGKLFGLAVEEAGQDYAPQGVIKHPDLLTLSPPPDKKQITIAQVREVTRFLTTRPLRGGHKIIIIRDANQLGLDAQHALLKTLEEPPGFAVIILLTSQTGSLLPTVVSRCIALDFRPLKRGHLENIIDTSALSPLARELLWIRYGGRPGSWHLFQSKAPELSLRDHAQLLLDNSLGLFALSVPDRLTWAYSQPLEEYERATEILGDWIASAQLLINVLSGAEKKLPTVEIPLPKSLLVREDVLRDMMLLLENLLALQAEWKPGLNTRLQLESQLIQWPTGDNTYER